VLAGGKSSGSEFGWRSGTGKWPGYYPDSLPTLVMVGKRSEKAAFGHAIIPELAPRISGNRLVQGLIQSEGANSKPVVRGLKTMKLPLCLCEENSPATTMAKIAYNQEIYVVLVKPFFE